MLVVIWLVGISPPTKLEEREQTWEGEWDGLQGRTEKLFSFFLGCKKADSSWEGGIVRVCMCIPATPAWLVSVSAYVTQNNRCHGSASVKGTGIFPSHSSLFFVLLVNVIQYHPPTTHTHTNRQVYFCFYSDGFFCHPLLFLCFPRLHSFSFSAFSLRFLSISSLALLRWTEHSGFFVTLTESSRFFQYVCTGKWSTCHVQDSSQWIRNTFSTQSFKMQQ